MTELTISQIFDLNGQVALVTGGAMGIGRSIALRLAEAGAAVVIADVDLEVARRTADEIRAAGGRALAVAASAARVDEIRRSVQDTLAEFGGLDILVNNAGVFPFAPLLDIDEAGWDRVLDINLKGAFFYSQAAAEAMIAAGKGGRIINIASIDALHPTGNLAHYDASKGGMVMLTRSLALELARHAITVNAVAPGAVITPGAQKVGETVLKAMGAAAPKAEAAAFTQRIPLGRQGDPDEIALPVLFLASRAATYITGETLIVDGGYLLS